MQFMGKEDVEEKHVKRTQKDYTLDFKLRVVRELETSHISMNAISRKYGEITIPDRESDIVENWKYDDQLGMFKLSEDR